MKGCKLSDSKDKFDEPPKIRVCFKEPTDDENSVEHE